MNCFSRSFVGVNWPLAVCLTDKIRCEGGQLFVPSGTATIAGSRDIYVDPATCTNFYDISNPNGGFGAVSFQCSIAILVVGIPVGITISVHFERVRVGLGLVSIVLICNVAGDVVESTFRDVEGPVFLLKPHTTSYVGHTTVAVPLRDVLVALSLPLKSPPFDMSSWNSLIQLMEFQFQIHKNLYSYTYLI